MRIASIAAAEAGIQVCCSVHDSFWILAPLDALDATIAQMTDIMVQSRRGRDRRPADRRRGESRRALAAKSRRSPPGQRSADVGRSPRADGRRAVASGWGIGMPRRPKLRLVGSTNPTDVFDDLTALRQEQRTPGPRRRQRLTETFARIPHDTGAGALSPDRWASVGAAVRAGPAHPERPRQKPGQALQCADECGRSQPPRSAAGATAARGGRSDPGRTARERSEPVGDASLVSAAGLAPQHGANPLTNMERFAPPDGAYPLTCHRLLL